MRRRTYTLLAIIVSTGLLSSYSTFGQTRSAAPDNASDAESYALGAGLNHPYFDWLTHDVPYIISPEERAAFFQLVSDDARDLFIEQFWQRRSPDPDSQDNSFKSEHYRRIIYSDEHFSTGITPGWKTDRGRIYIEWGQPDETESNEPAAGGRVETWQYRFLEGIGENVSLRFTDLGLTHDYRLVLQPDERSHLFQAAIPDGCTNETDCADSIRVLLELDPDDSPKFTSRFKELDAAISARAKLDDVAFGYHFDSIPATPFTTLVPVTIEIPSFELQARHDNPDQAIQLQLFLRITDSMGRVVETYEDSVSSTAGLSEAQASGRPIIVQKSIALRPGSYVAAIAVGNRELKTIGTAYTEVAVTAMSNPK
jgi:GWxTD domain-containing protein